MQYKILFLFLFDLKKQFNKSKNRDVFQLVEFVLWEHEVAGSSPVILTLKTRKMP